MNECNVPLMTSQLSVVRKKLIKSVIFSVVIAKIRTTAKGDIRIKINQVDRMKCAYTCPL